MVALTHIKTFVTVYPEVDFLIFIALTPPPDRGGWEVIRAEVISRSSSGGSDITITPALITPPSTPEPGINPWD